MVLKAISNKPDITHNELSESVFKDKASVTRIIDVLVHDKYLKRESHPESNRRILLLVTEKGKKLLIAIRPFVLKNRKHALKNISSKNLAITENVLRTISDNCRKN
jgi:DNA-binding MarR family transcriptional regulator